MADEQALTRDRVAPVAEFRLALREFLHRTERIAARSGLTPQRYLLLLTVAAAADGADRLTRTELGERLKVSKATVTGLVGRAEQAGLVRRERSLDDGRVTYVGLTPAGEERLARTLAGTDEARHDLAAAFARVASAFDG